MIANLVPLNLAPNMQLIAIVVSILLVYEYAPVETENKPSSKDEVLIYKRRSMVTVLISSIIILATMHLLDVRLVLVNIASLAILAESITLTPLFHSDRSEKTTMNNKY